MKPLFIATERFDASNGEAWEKYCQFAKIPNLIEVVSLDQILCPRLVTKFKPADWNQMVNEDFRLGYFLHLDYLLKRVAGHRRRNVLGVYRNPESHITQSPGQGNFVFMGYDLVEEVTQVSALTDCGGFPKAFSNQELSPQGLIQDYGRAVQVRVALAEAYPEEHHAQCELYAIWRLKELPQQV